MLPKWDARPKEEATLFNPAFCGMLAIEFVKEYQKSTAAPCPFVLPFCGLPIALHARTRNALPSTTLTSMYTWRERNPEVMVGYVQRAKGLRPTLQEAVRFCIDKGALTISTDGGLQLGAQKLAVSQKFIHSLTYDAQGCVSSARLLGRWFAKAGTTSTILSSWGIKP
ncbi:three component ABC system middle component [Pelagibius sp. 7325]|uniref:three component ABC system middle component n=1 Tax=Pelagibius sp. 7325 TaxID=3131994 RepID=UPI0034604859